jgi:hypothetical protein
MTTSEEWSKHANNGLNKAGKLVNHRLTKAELGLIDVEFAGVFATLSVAAAIREQTEQARENTLELACASRGVASPHPTWYGPA